MDFIHVKGHSADHGNNRADALVQLGKGSGPYSRRHSGGGEGTRLTARIADSEDAQTKFRLNLAQILEDEALVNATRSAEEGTAAIETAAALAASEGRDLAVVLAHASEPEPERDQIWIIALFRGSTNTAVKLLLVKLLPRTTAVAAAAAAVAAAAAATAAATPTASVVAAVALKQQ